jgi:hypothetical protein
MKKIIVSVLAVCLVFSATAVLATPVEVGDTVQFLSTGGTTGGGVFTIKDINQNVTFGSFCLERNEYISCNTPYIVAGITEAAVSGGVGGASGGSDTLSGKTAWLFYNFTMGTLPGYNGSQASQDLLQKAIWMLEGELDVSDNYFYTLAMTGLVAPNTYIDVWSKDYIGPVRVLNLVDKYGTRAQDQMVVTPEPLSLLLLGLGLMGVAGVRRKIK